MFDGASGSAGHVLMTMQKMMPIKKMIVVEVDETTKQFQQIRQTVSSDE
jgi:hypothetical protein